MAFGLEKMSFTSQLLVGVLLGGVAGVGFYYFYYAGLAQQRDQKKVQLKSLQDEVEKGKVTAARLPEFKREYELREARLQTLSRILPNTKEVDDLLRKVQALAAQSSLNVLRFKPEATRPVDFYAEWPISLELDGSYHNLAYFFDRISKLSRIVNVSNLKIGANPKPTLGSTIKANCTATTFVFIEPAEAPATTGAPGARPGAAPAGARPGPAPAAGRPAGPPR